MNAMSTVSAAGFARLISGASRVPVHSIRMYQQLHIATALSVRVVKRPFVLPA